MNKNEIEESIAETLGINKAYPKYQISKFLDKSRDYQIVIRTDNFDELMSAIKQVKPLVESLEKKAKQPVSSGSNLKKVCQLHKVEMIEREGKYGTFWSHLYTDEQTGKFWCDGKKMKIARED